ncbi:hypothetical protein, partial [Ensifer sp. Root231]|uniref:hypothetical protein n=1 Tax=Ensifer sp. Root231 TaxID=1736497 RepID=UPI001AECA3B4
MKDIRRAVQPGKTTDETAAIPIPLKGIAPFCRWQNLAENISSGLSFWHVAAQQGQPLRSEIRTITNR